MIFSFIAVCERVCTCTDNGDEASWGGLCVCVFLSSSNPIDHDDDDDVPCISLTLYFFDLLISTMTRNDDFILPVYTQNKVTMRIGYHELEGKIEKLKKPLAILERRNANDDDDDEQLQAEEEEDNEGRTADVQHVNGSPHTSQRNTTRGTKRKDETWYDVVGFVKTKIAFVSRPTAIISKPVPKSAPGTGNGIKYRRFSHGGTTALNLTPNPPSPTKA